jgi:hypothetical protein
MGTLPGAAPTKADLDAADRPLWKRINLHFPTRAVVGAQANDLEMKKIGTGVQTSTGELRVVLV